MTLHPLHLKWMGFDTCIFRTFFLFSRILADQPLLLHLSMWNSAWGRSAALISCLKKNKIKNVLKLWLVQMRKHSTCNTRGVVFVEWKKTPTKIACVMGPQSCPVGPRLSSLSLPQWAHGSWQTVAGEHTCPHTCVTATIAAILCAVAWHACPFLQAWTSLQGLTDYLYK